MASIRRLFLATLACGLASAFALAGHAAAASPITFTTGPGTGAPPPTLGTYTMTALPGDTRPEFADVGSVDASGGKEVSFSSPLNHRLVGSGWQTWSNGYTGDVYYTNGSLSTTLTMPTGTRAFYLYAEPNPFAVFVVSATAQDGTTSGPIPVDGYFGASYFGFYAAAGEKIATITVSSDIDFAIGEFGINAPARSYVAMGDSYSSGEGAPPFFPGTDGPSDYCHRSTRAYSQAIGAHYGLTPKFYACSGAVTQNITSSFHQGEPPQITGDGVDNTLDLLTLTIGGNDAGFADTLKACIGQKLKADVYNALIGPVARWLGFGKDPNCVHSSSFTDSVNTRIDNIFWPVKSTYLSLLSATSPDQTSIMAADYPRLFPVSHDDQGCTALRFILTNDDMDWMNGAGDRLDNILAQAAGEAGVNFVDVRSSFAGHEICGPAGAYLNGLSMASGSGGACTWSLFGHCIIPGIPVVGSFHPNVSGQTDGYGSAFIAAIDNASSQTDAGFPQNPPALPDPPVVTAIPPVGFGELSAQPLTAPSADCAGTYQAGQQVSVSGDGFAPNTSVQFYASSSGFGSQTELLVGTATADANGHAAATVRVPLAATGFTPQEGSDSSPVGIVVLDAIGLGVAADHFDDVALIGLAAHDAACGTVDALPFAGFDPPIANAPARNAAQPGRAIPVKFTIAGSAGTLDSTLAAGYPQSAPVACGSSDAPTSGDPTTQVGGGTTEPSDSYTYVWKTDRTWRGCRMLTVKLVDGSVHQAVFDFGS